MFLGENFKMLERRLYQKFKDKIKKADPNCWVYKIPDWIGGGKRPFDTILIIQGIPFAIEFKSEDGLLTKYQLYQLTDFNNAGGESLIFREGVMSMDNFVNNIMDKVKEVSKK